MRRALIATAALLCLLTPAAVTAQTVEAPLTDDVVAAADVVVSMGCGDACAIYPGKRYIDWTVDDPQGEPIETVRRIRDAIDERVRDLLAELETPTTVST